MNKTLNKSDNAILNERSRVLSIVDACMENLEDHGLLHENGLGNVMKIIRSAISSGKSVRGLGWVEAKRSYE